MPILVQGEIVVIHSGSSNLGGYVYLANDDAITIHRATLNSEGRVVFLQEHNAVIPVSSVEFIEKLHPRADTTAIGANRLDRLPSEEDSNRIKEWLRSKGLRL